MLHPVAVPVVVHLRREADVIAVDVVREQRLDPVVLGEGNVRPLIEHEAMLVGVG